jgi:hypothetical protein
MSSHGAPKLWEQTKDRPALPDEMLEWAGNAVLYQMGFFRWPGEPCCAIRCYRDETVELTDKQIYQLVIERMDQRDLAACVDPYNFYTPRPKPKISSIVFGYGREHLSLRSRSRSRSPKARPRADLI